MPIKVSIICSLQDNGSYVAVCPDLHGCFTQGDTYEQAICQIKDLINAIITEDLTDDELRELTRVESKIFSEYSLTV